MTKKITPQKLKELEEESRHLRKELRKRIKRMWDIKPEDWTSITK